MGVGWYVAARPSSSSAESTEMRPSKVHRLQGAESAIAVAHATSPKAAQLRGRERAQTVVRLEKN